jgi:hypothetical protein
VIHGRYIADLRAMLRRDVDADPVTVSNATPLDFSCTVLR